MSQEVNIGGGGLIISTTIFFLFLCVSIDPKKGGLPKSKMVISQKISPLPSWLFLKHSKEDFRNKKIILGTAWKSKKAKKVKKNVLIWQIVWLFTLKKTSMPGVKILAWKRLFFGAPQFKQFKSNCLGFLLQNVRLNKIFTLWKN